MPLSFHILLLFDYPDFRFRVIYFYGVLYLFVSLPMGGGLPQVRL